MPKLLVRSLLALGVLAPVASCGGPTPGATTSPSAITGSVIAGRAPLPQATIVLREKVGNQYVDREIKQADANGIFSFSNLPPGTYRVAFDRATPAERRNPSQALIYAPNTPTFGFFSSRPFNLGSGQTRQIPQLDVAWAPNLDPAPEAHVIAPATFSWNRAPGALHYRIRIADAQNNTVYTSPALPNDQTSFVWNGQAGGRPVAPGRLFWSLNVETDRGFGGTNISPFTFGS